MAIDELFPNYFGISCLLNLRRACHAHTSDMLGFGDPEVRVIRIRARFLYNAASCLVSLFSVQSFGSCHIDKQTHKQTIGRRRKHDTLTSLGDATPVDIQCARGMTCRLCAAPTVVALFGCLLNFALKWLVRPRVWVL